VVLFGDNVPRTTVETCYRWVDGADGLLVIGSSLMVFSGLRFVRRAATAGIEVMAINRGRTRADDLFAGKLDGDCGVFLQRLDQGLRQMGTAGSGFTTTAVRAGDGPEL